MALFVLSYARKDGEALARKFFERLRQNLSEIRPGESDVGFMDTSDIPTGAVWQDTLGGQLQRSNVLVPVFSPNFFASEECGREVEAFLERRRSFASDHSHLSVPRCIVPVVWRWDNLNVHPALRDFQYDHKKYPKKYRMMETGLKMLVDLTSNRDLFKAFAEVLAVIINECVNTAAPGPGLPLSNQEYRTLTSAFAVANPPVATTAGKSVEFAYLAPSTLEAGAVRQNSGTYGTTGREWRAFDPACRGSIGSFSESITANLNLQAGTLPLDQTFPAKLKQADESKKLVVFVVDSWVADMPRFAPILAEIDRDRYHDCPVLVPLNERDPENRTNRPALLSALAKKLPGRSGGNSGYFLPGLADEVEYGKQLARVLAIRQSDLINGAPVTAGPGAGLPVL